ncbi:hypothetical protein MLD38_033711 [Melastoma candidum]|uniref:Uncharacterized protein n=1 Tax=Melastoma candidum TaxID=119954 RepID=A0ACB9MBD7_9MYRT|nr:hypothetical protein MLD38_033711 [Melastoma candidum]
MADVDAAVAVPPEPPLASLGSSAVVATATVEQPSELLEKTDETSDLPHKEEVVTVEAPPPDASEEYKPPLVHLPPPQPLHEKLAHSSGSFKEESNKPSDLSDAQRVCLSDLRSQIQNDAALASASIWGIPLFKDERTDVILLKFLRARDFKVNEALAMFRNTVEWRAQFGIDQLLEEDLGDDLEKAVFMHGFDKEGHPVCFNVYGEFQNKEVYEKTFGNEEKRARFLRWRIQFLERSIRKLDFSPGGICTIFQVSDLKNSPGPGKKELRMATRLALQVLQDNYPEFVAKQVFINVPWWYLAYYAMISPFLTQRTRSKFVFASPARTPDTLFKYISPEQVPVQYGGLSVDYCDCNSEFTADDPATEMTVKPGTKQIVEIIVYERCVLVWELRVVGWEVRYGAEFVPNDEGGYSVNIQKPKKMAPNDEPVVQGSYKVSELGKVLLTIDNPTSKKKKLLYRFKVNPFPE